MVRSRSASTTSDASSSSSGNEHAQNLLQAALADLKKDGLEAQSDLVSLGQDDTQIKKRRRLDDTSKAAPPDASSSRLPSAPTRLPDDRFGQLPYKHLPRKAYLATKPKTKGSNWFELPAAPANPSQELRTEIAALKMASSIDPKRFLKGEAKKGLGKMPEHFHVGYMVQEDRPTRIDLSGTGSSEKRLKKRSFVEELVQSDDTTAYTKRKYAEVQEAAQSGGRGHYKKRFGNSFRGGRPQGKGRR